MDSTYVTQVPEGKFKIFSLPIVETAEKVVGRSLVANILALGVIFQLTKVVTQESLESAILARVPKGTEELNIKAFRTGLELAQKTP